MEKLYLLFVVVHKLVNRGIYVELDASYSRENEIGEYVGDRRGNRRSNSISHSISIAFSCRF